MEVWPMTTHIAHCVLYLLLAFAWYADHRQLDRRLLEAECKYELIDPVRGEAGVPLSECCQELLRGK